MDKTYEADLMSSISDRRHLLWKCLQAVARNEPRRLYIVLFEKSQEPVDADSSSKKTWIVLALETGAVVMT